MTVDLTKAQLSNLIDFIEAEFLDAVRRDEDLDNIDYVVNIMGALTAFRAAHAAAQKEE